MAAFWFIMAIMLYMVEPQFKQLFVTPLIYIAKAGFCYLVNRTYHAGNNQ
jgi:hypothetical protein